MRIPMSSGLDRNRAKEERKAKAAKKREGKLAKKRRGKTRTGT